MIWLSERLASSPDRHGGFWIAIVAAALFSIESWALGPYSWMYGYGAGLETIPTHLALLFEGRLFSPWAPFLAGGLDRFSFWGNADPLNWETALLAVFPVWLANGLHRFVQYFIAIYFTGIVLRDQLGLDTRPAVVGGLLYGCFSYFTFGELLALPALPLFLWLMERSKSSRRGPWLPVLMGLGFSTLTTFTHSVPYFAVFAALWSVVVLKDASPRAVFYLGLIVLGLALGDSPQLLAAISAASFSHRVGFPPETVSLSLDSLLYRSLRFDYFNHDVLAQRLAWELPLPLLTAGAVTIRLACATHLHAYPLAHMYLRVYVIYLLLSQRWLLVALQNAIGGVLPAVNGIYMGRFFDMPASFLIAAQLALLIALAGIAFGQNHWPRRAVSILVAALAVFMLLEPKVFLFYRNGVDGWGEKNYQVGSIDRLLKEETGPFRVASVLPLQPAYAYAQGLETADGWANLYPKVYRDYWLRVLAPLFVNIPGAKEIFDPVSGKPRDHYIFLGADLIDPAVGALPGEDAALALVEGFDVDRRFNLTLLGLLNVKYLLSEFPLKSTRLVAIHTPANRPTVAYSRDWATGWLVPPSGPRGHGITEQLSHAMTDLAAAMRRRSHGKDLYIYRLEDVVPRFRLVTDLEVQESGTAVLNRISSMNAQALRATAILEAEDSASVSAHTHLVDGRVRVIRYRPSQIELGVEISGNGFLVIANTWSPYWRALVDGHEKPLVRANHAQLGMPIEAGSHTISLSYLPPYLFGSSPRQ
jgi:hypothetical protein